MDAADSGRFRFGEADLGPDLQGWPFTSVTSCTNGRIRAGGQKTTLGVGNPSLVRARGRLEGGIPSAVAVTTSARSVPHDGRRQRWEGVSVGRASRRAGVPSTSCAETRALGKQDAGTYFVHRLAVSPPKDG